MAKKNETRTINSHDKPVHHIRLSTVSAAVFANQTEDGRTMYNVQFDRSYRDGDEWRYTKSFGWHDLLMLSKVADLAHSWIHEQSQNPDHRPEDPSLSA